MRGEERRGEGRQWRMGRCGEEKQRPFRDGWERVKEGRTPFTLPAATAWACGNSRLARAGLLDSLDGRADGASGIWGPP
jgi:hypothetical protein